MYRWLTSHDSRAQSFLILCYAMNAFELLDAELPFPRCDVRFSVDKLLECFFPFERMNEPFSVSMNKLNIKQIPASRDILFAYCPNHWTETFSSYISWSMLSFENRSEKKSQNRSIGFLWDRFIGCCDLWVLTTRKDGCDFNHFFLRWSARLFA